MSGRSWPPRAWTSSSTAMTTTISGGGPWDRPGRSTPTARLSSSWEPGATSPPRSAARRHGWLRSSTRCRRGRWISASIRTRRTSRSRPPRQGPSWIPATFRAVPLGMSGIRRLRPISPRPPSDRPKWTSRGRRRATTRAWTTTTYSAAGTRSPAPPAMRRRSWTRPWRPRPATPTPSSLWTRRAIGRPHQIRPQPQRLPPRTRASPRHPPVSRRPSREPTPFICRGRRRPTTSG